MPIILTPFDHGDLCHGWSWTVQDDDLLARHIAGVAIGQSRHVERILAGAELGPPPTAASSVAAAVSMLTVTGVDPYHRDGWLFQVMSWIAAHRATPGALIRAPHMILAHKGFDGLQLELDGNNHIVGAAILFEDKATDNPRKTIREDIWPDFSDLEAGGRENVLAAEVIALLRTQPAVDPDQAIQNVIWRQARRYRIAITVDATHGDDAGRLRLFDGYAEVAEGARERRRGETFLVTDLRAWMAQLAGRSIAAVRQIGAANV